MAYVSQENKKSKNEVKEGDRMKYILIDYTAHGKSTPSHGFANSKEVFAVRAKKEGDEILATTSDLSARYVSRQVAMRYADARYGRDRRDDGLWLPIWGMERDGLTSYHRMRA